MLGFMGERGRRPVLIVDDDVDVREILAETLVDRGFDVVTAPNGLEALKMLQRRTVEPSVILLDLMMPILDGYGFLERRRQDPGLASIPVAVITAGHGVDRERLSDVPAIVPKPIDVPKLVSTIRSLQSTDGAP